MLMTKRKPGTVAEILTQEFMKALELTHSALAEAVSFPRKHVNELCNDRRNVTAATALIFARVFGDSPDFRLSVERRKAFLGGHAQLPRMQANQAQPAA